MKPPGHRTTGRRPIRTRPRAPKPIATFFLRPERGSRLTVGVEVYRTLGDFRQAVRVENQWFGFKRSRTRGLIGQTVGLEVWRNWKKGRERKQPCFAIMRFPKRHLTMSTLTHEAFHATMRWANRRKILAIPTEGGESNITYGRYVTSTEERCATVHDNLCRLLVIQLTKRGLLPE